MIHLLCWLKNSQEAFYSSSGVKRSTCEQNMKEVNVLKSFLDFFLC